MSQQKQEDQSENEEEKPEQDKEKNEIMDFTVFQNTRVPACMLANIFLYLDRKDRMNCKIVCKHWLSVLMTDVYFKQDRHLYLNHCVLEQSRGPLTLFAKAPYGYNMITIGANVVLGTDSDECWDYFGDKIIYLDLAPKSLIMSAKYVKMLTSMPFIKILRVHNDGPLSAGLFGRAMELLYEQNIKLNLEELRIKCVNCNPIKNEYFDVFPKIIDVSPKLKKIHIESILERMVPELRKVMEDYPEVKVTINLVSHSDSCMWLNEHGPQDLTGIELECLDFSYEKNSPETLNHYLEKHKSIKGIILSCKNWPTQEVQDKVVALDFSLRITKNFSNIENFLKLKELTFSSIYSCLEVHTPVNHLALSKLNIKTAGRFQCDDCLKAMMLSFPNITDLSIEHESIKEETLTAVLELLSFYKNLKTFTLNGSNLESTQLKSALEALPETLTLPIVDLKVEFNDMTDEVARLICQKFILVKYLTLKLFSTEEGIASAIRTILLEMTSLKHVQFEFNSCDDEQEIQAIQEAFIVCGKELKTIALPFIKLTKGLVEKFFDKMPELHSAILKEMVVTRVENGQVHIKKSIEKPPSRNCRVSYPSPRRDHQDEDEHHNHHDFMNEVRNRRHNHMRMQWQRVESEVIDGIHVANRLQMNRARREARNRLLRRYMER